MFYLDSAKVKILNIIQTLFLHKKNPLSKLERGFLYFSKKSLRSFFGGQLNQPATTSLNRVYNCVQSSTWSHRFCSF
jgi:hypothetical protein